MSVPGTDLHRAFEQLSSGRAGRHEWDLCCEHAWGTLTALARSSSPPEEASVAKLVGDVSSADFATNASAWDRADGLPEQRRYRSLHVMVRCLDALLWWRARPGPDGERELTTKALAVLAAFCPAPGPRLAAPASPPAPPRERRPSEHPLGPLDALFDLLADDSPTCAGAAAHAKFWTSCLLSERRALTHLPVVAVDLRDNRGSVSRLSIGAAGPGGALLVHPESALQPLDASFLDAVLAAWDAAGADEQARESMWWSLPAGDHVTRTGDSAGAAFAVGFALAGADLASDEATAVCAAVTPDGALREVNASELPRKLAAAAEHGVVRVVLSDRQHLPTQGLPTDLELLRASTCRDAAELASGTAELVRGYLRELAESIDAERRNAPFLDDARPTELYVEPELLEAQGGHEQDGARWEAHNEPTAKTLYGREDADGARRISMAEFRDALDACDTVMIEGAPGSGKSLLVRAEVAHLARAQLARFAAGVPLSMLLLPIRVELTALEAALAPAAAHTLSEYMRMLEEARSRSQAGTRGSRSTADLELRAAVGSALERELGRQCAFHLAGRLESANVRLYFDGHDEVREPDTLAKPLTALADWRAPVVVTSRPAHARTIWPRERGRRPRREYVLAPFSPSQIDNFIGKRFSGDRELQSGTRQRLGAPSALGTMARSPFLLTLLCWLARRELLSDGLTRTQVYDRIVGEMLGWRRAGGGADAARSQQLLRMLSEIALRLFVEGRATGPIDGRYLTDLIALSSRRPEAGSAGSRDMSREEKAQAIVEELANKRVIVRILDGDERTPTQWAFPHLTIAEYLAGVEIADGLSEAIHVGEQPLWLSALRTHEA